MRTSTGACWLGLWVVLWTCVSVVEGRRGKRAAKAAKEDAETEQLLEMTGLPRAKFTQIVNQGRRFLSKSEWDPRHKLSYMGAPRRSLCFSACCMARAARS